MGISIGLRHSPVLDGSIDRHDGNLASCRILASLLGFLGVYVNPKLDGSSKHAVVIGCIRKSGRAARTCEVVIRPWSLLESNNDITSMYDHGSWTIPPVSEADI